jgi:hypothetical protein
LTDNLAFQEFDFPAPRPDCLELREMDEFLLLREMHHRFANTLTILTSVLRREFARSASPSRRWRVIPTRCWTRCCATRLSKPERMALVT